MILPRLLFRPLISSHTVVAATATKAGVTFLSSTSRTQQKSFSTIKSQDSSANNVVIVDGIRLPFAQTSTIYADQMAVDLQRLAFQSLITKTALEKDLVDYVIAGTVIQEVKTSNIAREAAINAGFPCVIGAHTVSMVGFPFFVFYYYFQ
mmetsp:Transcript_23462/g.47903  ORF Transcript_23462/g.47903 Transcript_23462/m.47903 type:complete len:150 (-) Transcript_23462:1409-1858(-)